VPPLHYFISIFLALPFCSSEKHLDWIKQEWNSRKDWWPAFHFSRYLAKRDWQENESLSYEKALLAGVLLGKGNTKCYF